MAEDKERKMAEFLYTFNLQLHPSQTRAQRDGMVWDIHLRHRAPMEVIHEKDDIMTIRTCTDIASYLRQKRITFSVSSQPLSTP